MWEKVHDLSLLAKRVDLKKIKEFEVNEHAENFDFSELGRLLERCELLRLCGGCIPTLRDLGTSWINLQVLYIHRCGLSNLSGVSAIPCLREFYCAFNMITDVNSLSGCSKLEIIDLEGNKIESSNGITLLAMLSGLRYIVLQGNPLSNYKAYRQIVVSKLPRITCLDSCPVTDSDRKPILPTEEYAISKETLEELRVAKAVDEAIRYFNHDAETQKRHSLPSQRDKIRRRPTTASGVFRSSKPFKGTNWGRNQKVGTTPSLRLTTRPQSAIGIRSFGAFPPPITDKTRCNTKGHTCDTSSKLTFGTEEILRGPPILALRKRQRRHGSPQ